jgi:hypothetical protein
MATSLLVELAVLIECGTYITDLGAMNNEVKFPKMLERYVFAINEIEDSEFESCSVRQRMEQQMYRAQSGYTGRKLWDKFVEVRSECRTLPARLPHDVSRIPSGKQLNDVYVKFLTNKYLEINVSTTRRQLCAHARRHRPSICSSSRVVRRGRPRRRRS